jgi:hypothetical protein
VRPGIRFAASLLLESASFYMVVAPKQSKPALLAKEKTSF